MDQLIDFIRSWLGGVSLGTTLAVAVAVFFLFNPEKVEKWSALLWRALSNLEIVFKGAHKQYLKHNLQGRLNEFTGELASQAPFLAKTRVAVEWVDSDVTRRSFLDEGKVILRLRRHDSQETNFVHGAYMFVSTSLIYRLKRYLAKSQRQAVDLYVTAKLLEREKASVRGLFLDEYLHPKTATTDSKIVEYFDRFAKIDNGKLFYPVLLQEFDFLGDKVFGKRRDDAIIEEASALIDFLEPIALRKVGDEGDLNFEREYCRFGIVIVGRSKRLAAAGAELYLNYIRTKLIPRRIETVYIRGAYHNKHILDSICEALGDTYEMYRARRFKVDLRIGGELVEAEAYLVVLRMKGVSVFQPSD